MTDMTIARTILEQLGGNRFLVMTGARDFVGGKDVLSFRLGRNKTSGNAFRVTLMPSDTYKVELMRVARKKDAGLVCKILDSREDVYCDQLQSVFTEMTGLYTHL